MLPMTVLRRFDCVLESTKDQVLSRWRTLQAQSPTVVDRVLNGVTGLPFHNHSELDFQRLKGDPDNIADHLASYILGFSQNVRVIFERFDFDSEISRLQEANRLYLIVAKFAEIDLRPQRVDNIEMGLLFEDLIRRFNEAANETAGDHFTPREVIRLMVNLLLSPDVDLLTLAGRAVTVFDPACGTGGMLTEAQNWIREHNEAANVFVYGQDYNPRSYAVAASDLLIKGNSGDGIRLGDTLTEDKFPEQNFDYLLANPPFGVDWKAQQKEVQRERARTGSKGRWAPGLPRVSDGALLFLLHMIHKFEQYEPNQQKHGSRCAVVFNGSPLFTGGAGSGESAIRRWIIEQDYLEAIVALPEQMFYNTGIGTFVWVVTNKKSGDRQGKIQLIDGRDHWTALRRNLGDKRRYLSEAQIDELTREHGRFECTPISKIYDNIAFGFRRITVDRPLRLCFQMSSEGIDRFLEARPEYLDVVRKIRVYFAGKPVRNWNTVWTSVEELLAAGGLRWSSTDRKLFRDCFTSTDESAEPVISRRGPVARASIAQLDDEWKISSLSRPEFEGVFGIRRLGPSGTTEVVEYEPDPALRDFENVPLKESIVEYFLREVRPYVLDAWIDRNSTDDVDQKVGRVGYLINFNREFFRYDPPRPLAEIDAELQQVEREILDLLHALTE